jgi:hypothetical protein
VSRKHITLDIAQVEVGESKHLHAKTKLNVIDNSKVGTWVNDERLAKGLTRALDRNDNKIKLGNYEHLFHIKWQPTVFSFPSLPRAHRQLDEPLADQRRILEPLGIKCIVDYVAQFTSHLVAKKRNTPTTLQALVNARYVVTDDYLQEVQAISLDALEQDFAANWPSELPYSPPPANEPNPRPDKSPDFLPNPLRSEIFAQYTFIFSDPGQHANLMPIINGGGGKALCHTVTQDSDIQDLLTYVREVAAKKSDRGFNLAEQSKSKGGIVLIRIGRFEEVRPGFYSQVDSSLGQSSIEQNELLETILDVDASKLKRPAAIILPAEDTDMESRVHQSSVPPRSVPSSAPRQSTVVSAEAPLATPEDITPEVSHQEVTASKRRGRRPLTQTKFKGFDEIDMNSLPKYRSPSPEQSVSQGVSQTPSNHVVDTLGDRSQPHPAPSQPSQRSSRKRPPPEDEETHQDMVADMLKGTAMMKKRRIAQGLEKEEEASSAKTPSAESPPVPEVKKLKRRKDKEIDVLAVLAERKQAEEEKRIQDEESLRDKLEGMDVAEMQNLAQIEEMDIVRREPPPRSRYNEETGHDDRWDERWNGRKNFKRFRKQNVQDRPRVFVSLQEVDTQSYGAPDDYFLEQSSARPKKIQKKSARSQQVQDGSNVQVTATPSSTSGSRSQTQKNNTNSISLISDSENENAASSEDDDTTARFHRRIHTSRKEDAEQDAFEALLPEEIAGTARDQGLADAARQSKTSASVRTQLGKRTAKGVVDEVVSQPARKRVQRRPSPDELDQDDDDDDDDDEENSTRFRRRKR